MKLIAKLAPLAVLAALVAACNGGSDTPPPAPLAPGAFDLAFGQQGIATLPDLAGQGVGATANFVVTQPNGSLWAAGAAAGTGASAAYFSRMYSDGTADRTLQGTGHVVVPPPDQQFFIAHRGLSVIARSGGKSLLVEWVSAPCPTGPTCSISGGQPLVSTVARSVLEDGSVDAAYGTNGQASVILDAAQVLAEPSGAVVLLGRVRTGAPPVIAQRNRLERLSPEGQVDAAWAMNANAAIDCPGLPPTTATGATAARQSDGRIVLVQVFRLSQDAGSNRICLSRLLPDGALDTGYATSGRTVLDDAVIAYDGTDPVALFPVAGGGAALFLQKRHSIAGYTRYHYLMLVFTAQGVLDASRFDHGISGPTDLHVARLTAVAAQADGKFLVAGYPTAAAGTPGVGTELYDESQPRIGRILPAGGADLTFGPLGSGYASLLSFGRRVAPKHVRIAPERSIFIAGAVGPAGPVNANEVTRIAVAKLAGDAAPAASAVNASHELLPGPR